MLGGESNDCFRISVRFNHHRRKFKHSPAWKTIRQEKPWNKQNLHNKLFSRWTVSTTRVWPVWPYDLITLVCNARSTIWWQFWPRILPFSPWGCLVHPLTSSSLRQWTSDTKTFGESESPRNRTMENRLCLRLNLLDLINWFNWKPSSRKRLILILHSKQHKPWPRADSTQESRDCED